jgi:AraC-like DNA-binding protein
MDPWTAVDPLGEALHFLRMSGVFYCRCEFTAPWGLALPPFENSMMFHVVTVGEGHVEVKGATRSVLRAGDLALVPHGEGHRLVSQRGASARKLFDVPRELISGRYEIIRHGGGGRPSTIICGVVRFDHPAGQYLTRLLPKLITVHGRESPDIEWVQTILRFMAFEARQLRPGGEAVITRLADILVIEAIRSWIATDPAAQSGWLGALRDQHIGRAIALIHRNPMRRWTVASLAASAGMSRSGFAERFTRLVGEPAMRYVTRWKMHTAMAWLKEDGTPLGELASRLGYESEAAFSRAFKRFTGISPGAVRRRGASRRPE